MYKDAKDSDKALPHPNIADNKLRIHRQCKILQLVGINEPERRYNQYPHELSGGMKQRVMIAIALVGRPSIIIADEPTTSLDVTIEAQILDLLKELQQKTHTSIIMITHDLGVIAKMCDRVIVMYGGKIMEKGTAEEIFYETAHPYTAGLIKSIATLDTDKNQFSIFSKAREEISQAARRHATSSGLLIRRNSSTTPSVGTSSAGIAFCTA